MSNNNNNNLLFYPSQQQVMDRTTLTPSRRPFQSLHNGTNKQTAPRSNSKGDLQEKFVTKNSNSTPAPIVVAPSVAAVREIDTHDDDEVQLYSIPQQESKYEDDLSIFRQQRPSCNSYEIEEMWTLKRANAVFEDDECSDDASEDDEIYQSPSKKQCQKLKWDQCCLSSSDDDTISFDLLSAASSTANDFYFR